MGKIAKVLIVTSLVINTLVLGFLLWSQLDRTSQPSVDASGADSKEQAIQSQVDSGAVQAASSPSPVGVVGKADNDGATDTDTDTATGRQQSVGGTFLALATQRSQQHCVSKIDQLSRFLGINEKDAAVLSYYNKDQPSDQLVSAVLASKGVQGGQLAVLDVSQGQGCAATYELIKVWSDSCDRVVAAAYLGYSLKTTMASLARVYEGAENRHVFVWPLTDTSCLTLQKEMLY